MDLARDTLAQFEETFDYYSRTCARPNNTSIVERLQQLRDTLKHNMAPLGELFVEWMATEPNLVRLDDQKYDYVCFGDLHGSLTDLVHLRQCYWRDAAALERMHFVFLGKNQI